ncbi:MAG: transglutaminase family protein [Rhodospirillales bacterium]|nr:transglutaminase family protein [Rhodospirillales bacterium]MDE2576110.1 transglutaminase family protein [Rhodospirillales bacterium]
MKYRIHHTTAYSYGEPVDLASHMLHLSPRTLPWQRVLAASFSIEPRASRINEGEDHFANHVARVFLDLPHERFVVTVQARVDVAFPPPPSPHDTPAWEAVVAAARDGGPQAWQAAEFAFASPMAPADAGAGAYVRASFPPGRPIFAGLLDLTARIRQDFAFRPGVTTVHTPVSRVLAQRAGVCQDFTHLMIAGLRALGLPARYVSGYLRTRPPPGRVARRGVDQSHAWVGCWLGPAHGWVDLDPTNNLVVQDEHVVLAWGRDYGDISPVRGVILGGGAHSVAVSVDLEAEA